MTLRTRLEESDQEKHHKIELYELRNQNLQQLNKKYEAGRNTAHPDSVFSQITSPDYKSTQVETERIKQYVQQCEITNMDLKHKLDET